MRQLTSTDAAFIYAEGEGKHNHLSGVYIYDQSTAPGGAVRFKDIMRHVESRLHRSPVFRQKLVKVPLSIDYPYWEDDDRFDIEFHLRHIALPQPGDWRQFCIQVARLHSRPVDMSRPPWEMYVIEGLDNIEGLPAGCFAIVAKYHHAAIDGATGVELLGALHDLQSTLGGDEPPPPWLPQQAQGNVTLLRRALLNNIRSPLLLTRSVAATVPGFARQLLRRDQGPPANSEPVPDTRFNKRVSPHRVFEGREFSLNVFRAIKNSVPDTTLNDVILAVCGGALKLYLEDKQELPEESLVALVPVNIRSENDATPGNQVSAMLSPLATHVTNARERLQAIAVSTRQAKATSNAVSARQMTDFQQHIPSSTLALAGRLVNGLALATRKRFCNCIITNVPGPQVPIYKNGAKLVAMWGCGPVLDGVGLLILATSYNGKVFLSASSCRKTMPDASFFAQCLQQSYEELAAATLGSTQ